MKKKKSKSENLELYKKYRPQSLEEIFGNEEIKIQLKQMIEKNKVPHSCLFSGGSGSGKTTVARILAKELKAGNQDIIEINSADFRGVDTIREINQRIPYKPISGKNRVWIIDEAHQLTSAAQNAFLKILEDTPRHVYFFLCTTDPIKLIPTIRNRCAVFKMDLLNKEDSKKLLESIEKKENLKIPRLIIEVMIKEAEGSGRKLLVLLDSIQHISSLKNMLKTIKNFEAEKEGIELCRALSRKGVKWKEIADIIKGLKSEPEEIRNMVLGYASSILLSGNPRGYLIIEAFREPFWNSRKAGLVSACWEVVETV